MVLNPIKILLFGNLLFFVLDFQLGAFLKSNIYVAASLSLNIILLFAIKKISKIPKIYALFFMISLIGLATSCLVLNFKDFLMVSMKYLWVLSSGFLLNHLISVSSFKIIFEELNKFAIFTGYFVLADIFLSLLVFDNAYMPNEGIKSLLIKTDNAKKLSLMILPFFFLSERRNVFIGCLILLYLTLGTRALILASGFVVLFSSFYFLKSNFNMRSMNKAGSIFLIIFTVITISFVLQNTRTIQLTSIVSLVDRVVIWSRYLNVIADYPMGLGPEGGYYLIRKNSNRSFSDLSTFKNLLENHVTEIGGTEIKIENLVDKRIRINQRLNKVRSSESVFIDFVCSFGVAGLCLILTLFFSFIKDLKTIMRFGNVNFSILYISLGGTLVYGLFNSFHQGMFFIIFLYVLYYKGRSVTFKNGSFNEISNPQI